MIRSKKKLGKKSLKVFQTASDGLGGSKLLQKTYAPTSPKKSTPRQSESPPKSKRQRTDDIHDFGGEGYEEFLQEPESDPRQTKVSGIFAFTQRIFNQVIQETKGLS